MKDLNLVMSFPKERTAIIRDICSYVIFIINQCHQILPQFLQLQS